MSGPKVAGRGSQPAVDAVPIVASTLVALGFYATTLGPRPWIDESATQEALGLSLPRLLDRLADTEAALVPYYVVMWPWAQVSDSMLWLRLPSVVAMSACAVVVAGLAERVVRPGAGPLAFVTFLVLPVTSRYAGEARPYAIVMLAAALAGFALASRPRHWHVYSAALVVASAMHFLTVLLLPAHAVVEHGSRWRRALLVALPVPAALALLTLAQGRQGLGWIDPLTPALVAYETTWRLTGLTLGSTVVVGLAITGAWLSRREQPLLLAWLLIPPTALATLGLAINVFWPRYLLYVVPAISLGLAVLLARLPFRWRLTALAGLVAVSLPAQLALRLSDGHQYLN